MAFPFDRSFKLFSDEDQRGHLALFSGVALDADIEVVRLDRELNVTTKRVDTICRVTDEHGESIHHHEVVSHYRSPCLEEHYWYVHLLVYIYRMRVNSCLILLTEAGVPEWISPLLKVNYVTYRAEADIRIVKMWELSAKEAMALNRLSIYPLVPLMDATLEEEREAAHRIVESGRHDLAATMALLGGLRYGDKTSYLERIAMLEIDEEILKDSVYYQYLVEKGEEQGWSKGRQEGRQQGRQEGREEGEITMGRAVLRNLLTSRFGSLPEWSEARIVDASADRLLLWIERAHSGESIEAVLA